MVVAVAPRAIKTSEKPTTNATLFQKAIQTILWPRSRVRSSKENPVMKERYPGTIGSTQGEKKERAPANRDVNRPTSKPIGIASFPVLMLAPRKRFRF